ncbi:neocarzinostatin apoprotein domain-containing protein [Nocardia inohanensis]|uniref:neocarzinostatin apoprotein domain-containing protein n=1 Tax=Nocardia inohanensis TaxID=209246 RepID=UPI00083699B1|nr:neocarzinostatin apoprotein domain-containing protein [Nocardia inohanensis]
MKQRTKRLALLAATATGLLVGAPAATAAPHLEATPTSGLSVGQSVTIKLDGLPANMASVAVGQCKPQIVAPTDCNLTGALMGKADEQGTWQAATGNAAVVLVGKVGDTDCTAAPGACTLSVTSLTNPSQILASIPLSFGSAPTTAPAAASSSVDADDDSDTGWYIGGGVVAVLVLAAVLLIVFRRRGAR